MDTDDDGISNNADPDDDNDGFNDSSDEFPLDASKPGNILTDDTTEDDTNTGSESDTIAKVYPTNISTRANINGGANDIFAGFIIKGTGTQQVIIRGIAVDGEVDPSIILFKRNGTTWDIIAKNDNWTENSNINLLATHLQLPNKNGNDAGLLMDLEAGIYSLQLSSLGNNGLAIVGIDVVDTTSNNPKLINISTRSHIDDGKNYAIAGFIITGSETQQVIIRGIAIDAEVNPAFLLLKRTGNIWTEIAVNDKWENDNNADAVTDLASHLQLPDRNGNDAGLLIDLEPGVYTVQMGFNDGAGLAVVGVDVIE